MADIYTKVTARIIQAMEKGIVPWRKPWRASGPMNLASKRTYRGVNLLLLSITEFESPYWCSFKQARRLGGSVKAGEQAQTFVVFAKESVYEAEDTDGNKVVRKGFVLKYSPIFNIEQTSGVKLPEEPPIEHVDAEEYLRRATCKPDIRYGGDKAYYSPTTDRIQMPTRTQFVSSGGFYSTLFHEIGHWTGGPKRLNRNFETVKETRAREELTAEMFSTFALNKVGLDVTVENEAAYIRSWIQPLKSDPRALIAASHAAGEAIEYFERGKLPGDAK